MPSINSKGFDIMVLFATMTVSTNDVLKSKPTLKHVTILAVSLRNNPMVRQLKRC